MYIAYSNVFWEMLYAEFSKVDRFPEYKSAVAVFMDSDWIDQGIEIWTRLRNYDITGRYRGYTLVCFPFSDEWDVYGAFKRYIKEKQAKSEKPIEEPRVAIIPVMSDIMGENEFFTVIDKVISYQNNCNGIMIYNYNKDEMIRGEQYVIKQQQQKLSQRIEMAAANITWNVFKKVAGSEATILVTGPTGTGKGYMAEKIYFNSDKFGEKFYTLDCGTLAPSIIESELFGFMKGAFTDAKKNKKGLLEVADNGTLFLDEVGNLSMETQKKLLRFLQEKKFRRIGDVNERKANLRIIAATNVDLEQAVLDGRFREDLYYRLKIFEIKMIPLAERGEDHIVALVEQLISEINEEMNKNIKGVAQGAMCRILDYTWPGNVRELRNALKTAATVCNGEIIEIKDLSLVPDTRPLSEKFQSKEESLKDVTKAFQKRIITATLQRFRGNVTKAARLLKLSRYGLIKKIDTLEIQNEKVKEKKRKVSPRKKRVLRKKQPPKNHQTK